jgi:hypothetical protein
MFVNIFLSCGLMMQLARHMPEIQVDFLVIQMNQLYDLHRSHILHDVSICKISNTFLQDSDIVHVEAFTIWTLYNIPY